MLFNHLLLTIQFLIMKKIWFLASLSLLIINYSCSKKDPCEDIVCKNGGTCESGTCKCPTGYEGATCETESLPKSIKVSGIKITKWPATKSDGSKWDTDNSNPDIFPLIFTMKPDGKAVDQVFWQSNTVLLNTTNPTPTFSLLLPELKFTSIDKQYAIFLYEKDDATIDAMGPGIIFNLKDFIKGRPSIIVLSCTGATCLFGFELSVSYEF
jgi:hypothetical protein